VQGGVAAEPTGGLSGKLPICRLSKMIILQSLTRCAGAPYGATQWILTWEPFCLCSVTAPFAGGEPFCLCFAGAPFAGGHFRLYSISGRPFYFDCFLLKGGFPFFMNIHHPPCKQRHTFRSRKRRPQACHPAYPGKNHRKWKN